MDTIKIIQGDITQASVDAIVNAANSQMLGGGGVYGYPPQKAARISIFVCKRPEYHSVMKYFYLFSDEMAAIWMAALEHP